MLKKSFLFFFKSHRKKTLLFGLLLIIAYLFCLPNQLFRTPISMVLEDQNGNLLGARIATDGQWRFPSTGPVPKRFAIALTTFEDRRFYQHLGIDPIGIGRAIQQNFKNRKIVSGGSTLTMQTIRMARNKNSRSFFQKLIEAIQATRLELTYSKEKILSLYSANAPFGGNVVGLNAASWRYYGKQPDQLSWAEAATLAVLPNSPSLIHPGRNRAALRAKRNRLLERLVDDGKIDKQTLELSLLEKLPKKPLPLPNLTPHLLEEIRQPINDKFDNQKGRNQTNIDRDLQIQVNEILERHQQNLSGNGIQNLAALVIDVEKNEVIAYTGNVSLPNKKHESSVNIIPAPRSTGSILKPFLYAFAIDDGQIAPTTLLSDVPLYLNGYRPENFHQSYDGMVSAKRVLARSLNVPMVRLLQDYGLEKFHFGLGQLNLSSINRPPSHYGLTLILGGAESSLWEITNAYAGMARTLNHFQPNDGRYNLEDFKSADLVNSSATEDKTKYLQEEVPVLSASACWHTMEAMRRVERPNSEGEWERFGSNKKIGWKTGTSFGFRDAWAVGVTPRYVVGVWAGNADGEGRPGLVGVKTAGPVLFDIFSLLKSPNWFSPPLDEMQKVSLCKESGLRALNDCPVDTLWLGPGRERLRSCRFHHRIHLDDSERFRVNSDCWSTREMVPTSWFVLPPIEEFYYRNHHPDYQPLPPFHPNCSVENHHHATSQIQIIYPPAGAKIIVPIDLDGQLSKTIFRATHRNSNKKIFWHLNQTYLGSTQDFHELALNPPPGKHSLTLIDESGEQTVRSFEILGKEN